MTTTAAERSPPEEGRGRDAASFLQMIRRSVRGRLKVYLGYGPGVGKTYAALQELHRLKAEGVDAVVGFVETHGRAETAKLVEGLETVPRRQTNYHGIEAEEMDLDAVLARRPQVALVDELAHTNLPGGRHGKRYEDVRELLAAGIHVITTVNVQHMESLYHTVEQLVGVKVRERLPDAVLADADVVVNVDLAAEDLRKRLERGHVYPPERAQAALANFFTPANLEHLRELTLREAASQIDAKRREGRSGNAGAAGAGGEQVMVCLSSRGPNSAKLLRVASRLAGRLNRNWYAVYVQTPQESPTTIDARTQRLLGETLKLANQLGATVFTFKGEDVAGTILRFAREYSISHVVIGRPGVHPWWERWRDRLLGRRSVAHCLLESGPGLTMVVVDAEAPDGSAPPIGVLGPTAPPPPVAALPSGPGADLAELIVPDGVVIWDEPPSRAQVFATLSQHLAAAAPPLDPQRVLVAIEQREAQGSTFLNEGVALPHARLDALDRPRLALGVLRAGLLDPPPGPGRHDIVLMMLTPMADPAHHLRLLGAAGRLLGDTETRRLLIAAGSADDILRTFVAA